MLQSHLPRHGLLPKAYEEGAASRGLGKPWLPVSGRNTCALEQASVPCPCLLAWHHPGMHPAMLQQAEIHPAHLAHTKVTCSPNTDYVPKSRVRPTSSGNTPYLPPPLPHSPAPPGTICMRRSRLAHKIHVCCSRGRIPLLQHEGAYQHGEIPKGHSQWGSPGTGKAQQPGVGTWCLGSLHMPQPARPTPAPRFLLTSRDSALTESNSNIVL